MAERRIYVNTIGLSIIIDMGRDMSGSASRVLEVMLPGGTVTQWTSIGVHPDNSNWIVYTTVSGSLPQEGLYRLQPSFTLGGWSGLGQTISFRVYGEYD